jgi:hypothetical protein
MRRSWDERFYSNLLAIHQGAALTMTMLNAPKALGAKPVS